jgi:hypothetical protein
MAFNKKKIQEVEHVVNSIRGPYMGQDIPEDSLKLVEHLTVGDLIVEFGLGVDEAAETLRSIQIACRKNSALGFKESPVKESRLVSRLRQTINECACEEMDSQESPYHPSASGDGFTFEDSDAYEEAGMIKSNLFSIASKAQKLHDMVGDSDNLPEWVQEKIAVVDEMIDVINDYLEYEYIRSETVTESKPPKGFLFHNINKRKKAGTSRTKSKSTIDPKTYKKMKKW